MSDTYDQTSNQRVKMCQHNIIRMWVYICSYCNWDTSVRKFAYAKESDLSLVIDQIKEHSNKGFLRKMYDCVVFKLKENEGLFTERK